MEDAEIEARLQLLRRAINPPEIRGAHVSVRALFNVNNESAEVYDACRAPGVPRGRPPKESPKKRRAPFQDRVCLNRFTSAHRLDRSAAGRKRTSRTLRTFTGIKHAWGYVMDKDKYTDKAFGVT